MKNRSAWETSWKALTISGSLVTLLGYGLEGLSYGPHGLFHPSKFSFEAGVICFICTLIGIACLSIGLVSWAFLLGESGRARITAFGFTFPIALAFIGYLGAHGDSHGSFPIFILPLVPLILVAFILLWLW